MTLPTVNTAAALRLAGKRGEIHPADAIAFAYPDRAYFEASANQDREIHHNDVIGPLVTDAGLIGIVDLRRQLAGMGLRATDPSLPDEPLPVRWRLVLTSE